MVRCSVCGRRLPGAQASCPQHGATADQAVAVAADGASAPSPTTPAFTSSILAIDAGIASAFAGLGYRLLRVLGRGGFATVYLAESAEQRQIAIKVAHREHTDGAARLTHEANVLSLVGAPHVPAVLGRGALLGYFYVLLEYLPGQTLADCLLESTFPMPLPRFASLATAILQAVEGVHAQGVVHRDLKPENIFIDENGDAKVIDFELAMDRRAPAEVRGGADVGTAEYISPEQCDGLVDADPRSDVYSLGALLYELLSGAPPFFGKSGDVREAHRSRRPAPLWSRFDCPRELDAVIRRCLAKDRARRFDTVLALRNAVDVALAEHRRAQSAPWHAQTMLAEVPQGLRRPRRPSSPPREKRTMGLVFFESQAGIAAVQQSLTASGGQLLQINGQKFVAGFGHDAGDNPARMALLAAQRLYAGKLAQRPLVEVAQVSVQQRADGSSHVFSAMFTKKDQFPVATDPAGVLLSASVIEVLPHLKVSALDGFADRFVLAQSTTPKDPTTYGAQIAPLVGRDELLRQLMDSARAAFAGRPTLFTITGAPGLGRTHLASMLVHQIERSDPGLDVVRMTAQRGLVGAVSHTLAELLRRVLRLPLEAPADGGQALLSERLSTVGEQVWAAAALSVGWVDADHPAVRRLAAAPGALRLAAARAAGEAFRRSAERKPLALVLDDAQLADDATLDALEYATLKEAGARIWVCILVEPNFERARPPRGSRAAVAVQHTLLPLEPPHAMELARRLLLPAEHVPPPVLARLAERTQGVPRLLVELVRGLKRDGIVRRSERGDGYTLATDELDKLPGIPIVEWNAQREVAALPPQLADHARLASVLGAGFTVTELEELLQELERAGGLDDHQVDAAVGVQRLIDAGVLVRHRNGRIDFRHALLRDIIYRSLSDGRRERLHKAAYEMYQRLALPHEHRLPRLALHAAHSGAKESAAKAYLELAERALKAHAYLESEAAFGRALENLPEQDERVVAAERGRGLMRFRLGRSEDALKDLRHACERARALGLARREAELLLDEAMVLDWTRDFEQSAARVRTVEALLSETTGLLAARLAMSVARVAHREGAAEACVRLGVLAASRAERLGDEGYETRLIALMMVAPDCANLGRLEDAERYFESVIAEADRHGDLLHLGAAFVNRALLWFARKDTERLFADLSRAVQISREIGEPRLEYCTLCNMAEVEYAIERLDAARQHTERALVLARQLWGESMELGTRELLLARIALYAGDFGDAGALAARVRARLADQQASTGSDVDLSESDRALLGMVELRVRDAGGAEWEALAGYCRQLSLQPHEELEILESRALAARARGEHEVSRRLFESALALSRMRPNLLSERVARRAAQHS